MRSDYFCRREIDILRSDCLIPLLSPVAFSFIHGCISHAASLLPLPPLSPGGTFALLNMNGRGDRITTGGRRGEGPTKDFPLLLLSGEQKN